MIYYDFNTARKNLAQGVILISKGTTQAKEDRIEYAEKEQYILYADKYAEARDYTRDLNWCRDIMTQLNLEDKKYNNEYIFLEAYNLMGKMKANTKIEDLNLGSLVPVRCFYRLSLNQYRKIKSNHPKFVIKRLGVMNYANM